MNNEPVPVRKCTVCGNTYPKERLVRYAVVDGKIYPDFKCRLQGRGLYTCHSKDCIRSFFGKKKVDSRFFEGEVSFAIKYDEMMSALLNSIKDSMKYFSSLSVKAGLAAKGQNTVQDLLSAGFRDFAFILVASDVAENTLDKLERLVENKVSMKNTVFSKADLGQFFSARPVGVVGLKKSPISDRICDCVELFNNLNEGNSRC